MTDMYKLQQATVSPVEKMLDAAIALNFYAREAEQAGWDITFGVNELGTVVSVSVQRDEIWPSPESEEEL